MATLSKSKIIAHRQCPRRLWLQVNRPELAEADPAGQARMQAGHTVGEVARNLHAGGVLVESLRLEPALQETAQAMKGRKRPVFEAAFVHRGVQVRADLLRPVRGGYDMVEVKSAAKVKDYYLEDIAVQHWVAIGAGLPLKQTRLAHINTAFIYPGGEDYRGLFTEADLSTEALARQKEVPRWINAARKTLAADEPAIEPGPQCNEPFACPFQAYCQSPCDQPVADYPVGLLPNRNGKQLAAALQAEGYADLRKVPKARIEGSGFERIWQATKTGKPFLDSQAAAEIRALGYPRHYLDFESINPAVPMWKGTRPYQQVPFQWSCHRESRNGRITHRAYLAESRKDPRPAFVESLLRAVGSTGPVLVYSAAFEKTRLKELADAFPRHRAAIGQLIPRVVDLLPIAKRHYYHRDMQGSWSIKAVLPTIAPELAYDGLAVADGGMAQEAFLEMLHPQTPLARQRELRESLLIYCERDTLAMLALAQHFATGTP